MTKSNMITNGIYTRAPPRGRLMPPATLAQGGMQLKQVKGAERRGPRFGANSEFVMPRAVCAELIALCCAVCLLAVSRSDRQCWCNLRGGRNRGTERDRLKKKQKYEYTTRTYRYLVLRFIPVTAVCSKESTTQHDTAPQRRARCGTAPHRTALRR